MSADERRSEKVCRTARQVFNQDLRSSAANGLLRGEHSAGCTKVRHFAKHPCSFPICIRQAVRLWCQQEEKPDTKGFSDWRRAQRETVAFYLYRIFTL